MLERERETGSNRGEKTLDGFTTGLGFMLGSGRSR